MKSGVLALDPVLTEEVGAEGGFRALGRLQGVGLLKRLRPVGIIHAGIYPLPRSYFEERKEELVRTASSALSVFCSKYLKVLTPRVIASSVTLTEDSIHKLCRFTKQEKADILILRSTDRKGAQYWLLGSFAETAALTADVSTLIVKPESDKIALSRCPSIIVPHDSTRPLSTKFLDWIVTTAKLSDAVVKLIYVSPKLYTSPVRASKPRGSDKSLLLPESISSVADQLCMQGVNATATTVAFNGSIGSSIVGFADREQGWMIAMFSNPRSRLHRIMMGSVSRQVLRLTKRPFVVIR